MTEEELEAIEALAEEARTTGGVAVEEMADTADTLVAEVRRLRAHDREAVAQVNAAEADLRQAQADVRRWKTCATEMSHRYEGREPRPEEWPDGAG